MLEKYTSKDLTSKNILDFLVSKFRINNKYAYFKTNNDDILDEATFNKIAPIKFKDTIEFNSFSYLCKMWDLFENTKYDKGLIENHTLIDKKEENLEYFNLTTYFPKNKYSKLNQYFVFNFKEGKNTEYYADIFSEVINELFCHNQKILETVIILPIPASSQEKTEKRYEKLFNLISQKTGTINGYDMVKVLKNISSKHLSWKRVNLEDHIKLDLVKLPTPIKILIIDDVITQGRTFKDFVTLLKKSLDKNNTLNYIFIKGLFLSKTIDRDTSNILFEGLNNEENYVFFYPKKEHYKDIKNCNFKLYINNNKNYLIEKKELKLEKLEIDSSIPSNALYQKDILLYSKINDVKMFYFAKYYSSSRYKVNKSFFYDLIGGKKTEFYANIFSEALIRLFGKYRSDNKRLLETMTLIIFDGLNSSKISDGKKLFELISQKTGIINGFDFVEKIPDSRASFKINLTQIPTPRKIVILDYLFPVKPAKRLLKQMEIENILPTKISPDDSFAIILSLYGSGYEKYSHSIEKLIEKDFNIFEEE